MKIAQTLRYCSIKSDKVSGGRNPPRGQKNKNLGDLVFVCVIRVLRVMQGSARSVRSLSWLKCDLITSELLQLVSWPHPLKKDQPFFFFFFYATESREGAVTIRSVCGEEGRVISSNWEQQKELMKEDFQGVFINPPCAFSAGDSSERTLLSANNRFWIVPTQTTKPPSTSPVNHSAFL